MNESRQRLQNLVCVDFFFLKAILMSLVFDNPITRDTEFVKVFHTYLPIAMFIDLLRLSLLHN
jgi:hypothetical protein